MAEVGTYYITIMPDMSKFTGGVNKALSGAGTEGGKKYSKSFGEILKGSAIGTALGNLAVSAGRSIMGGLQTGIGRLDTIKNFPKVMDALGFSANDAQKSIQLIMERLDGLPTATQDVVTLTQAIADSTGDLDLATKAALGFNDMMLANGASAAEVVQAQGVLNRVLGKGNATVAQWQSLQSVMPAQLAAVARELGGEGMSVEELRDKLNDGTISWDEFLQAIVKLDTEGSGAMKSFNDQARANSVGIGTALANVQNRIGAGWASILDAFGQENISGTIDKVSYGIRDGMQRIADGIGYVRGLVADTAIGQNLAKIGEAVGAAFERISQAGAERLKPVADALVGLVDGGLQWLVDNGPTFAQIGDVIGSAFDLIATSIEKLSPVAEFLWQNVLQPLADFLGGAFKGALDWLSGFFEDLNEIAGQADFTDFVNNLKSIGDAISGFFPGLVDDFQNMMGRIKANLEDNRVQWEKFKANVKNAVDNVKTAVGNAIRGVLRVFKSLKEDVQKTFQTIKRNLDDNKVQWEKFKENVKKAAYQLKTNVINAFNNVKTNVTNAINGLKTNVTNIWNAIKTTVTNTVNGIKTGVTNAWNGLKTNVTNAVNGLRTSVTNAWNGLKSSVSSIVTGIKTSVTNTWTSLKTSVSNIANGVKTAVTDKFNALKSSVKGIWDGIKSAITGPIESAKSKVSGIIDKIKGFFPIRLSNLFSGIRLPHFTIDWTSKTILGKTIRWPAGVGVSWYAQGGLFNSPAIIGVGEGGPEAALPLNDAVYRRIARGIAAEGGGGGVTITGNTFYVREEADIDRIAGALARKIRREGVALA